MKKKIEYLKQKKPIVLHKEVARLSLMKIKKVPHTDEQTKSKDDEDSSVSLLFLQKKSNKPINLLYFSLLKKAA